MTQQVAKLITEATDQVEYFYENDNQGVKQLYIEGIFAQAVKKNKNGRVYPLPVMESAVYKYINEKVNAGSALGELDHPPTPIVQLHKVSHRITELYFEGNDVMGKALIMNTASGDIARGLIEGGVNLGVSTRGMGSLKRGVSEMVVESDYRMNAVDIVSDPSASDAVVNAIMEGVDWVCNNGIWEQSEIDKTRTEIDNAWGTGRLDEVKLQAYRRFLFNVTKKK